MAVVGEPLGFRSGVGLYSAQATYGTPVTPATAIGDVTFNWIKHSSNAQYRGPGSADVVAQKGGSTYTEWAARFMGVPTGAKALILKAFSASGLLSLVTMGFGYKDDAGTRSAGQIQDCKIDSLELGLDASGGHGPLTASMHGIGGLVTTLTSLDPATLASKPWYTYEAVLLKAGAAYPVRSLSLNIANRVSRDHVVPGTAPVTFIRGHSYLSDHDRAISGSVSRYAAIGDNVHADTIVESTMGLVITCLQDSVLLTLALTGVTFEQEEQSVDEGGIIWTAPFTALTIAGS